MTLFPAKMVAETGMQNAFRTVLIIESGEAEVIGFDEGQLNPDKTMLIHTSAGDFNIENGVDLGVYMDQEPAI